MDVSDHDQRQGELSGGEADLTRTRVVKTPQTKSFASGRYVTEGLLGAGGQKIVYLARDTVLDRLCALAILNADLLDTTDVARIRSEARTVARFGSRPNIVTVYDFGDEDGTPYIVSEYVPGGDLRSELKSAAGPLPLERTVAVAADICRALQFAHRHGIVHRDLKPENVYLDEDGSAKLGDFGVALVGGNSRLTAAGEVTGTPAYMAPEQASGEGEIDARTDLYSFGAILFELLTGRPPFEGETAMSVIAKHVHAAPPEPLELNGDIPPGLAALTTSLLAKRQDERPASAEAVLKELQRAVQPGGDVPRVEAPTTFLYSDLVNSTQILQRLGDERAHAVFEAHHKLLREAIADSNGREIKWQGDGVMAAFGSAAAAVRCAIAMQRGVGKRIEGEALQIRVGVNVGEALGWADGDYFGTPVVIAARLCSEAAAGQILCTSLVAALLSGRQAYRFRDLSSRTLKGFDEPVATCEVIYETAASAGTLVSLSPFVGRDGECAKLEETYRAAAAGRGGLVMLSGEPGIGKTRMAQEFAGMAKRDGATVLWGRCYEGEWAPPYCPFAEAIREFVRGLPSDDMRRIIETYGGPLAQVVPELRDHVTDVPTAPDLAPDEERFRLLDAVAQLLLTGATSAPLVLVLDDLHWADKGSIAMLRHVARFVRDSRILIVGTYRDVELDREHPFADALGALGREAEYDRIALRGLDQDAVAAFLGSMSEGAAPDRLVTAISSETQGNPYFLREVVLHLMESSRIMKDGQWQAGAAEIEEWSIPEGVRQVIGRRLSRLSPDANKWLGTATAFSGPFPFEVVSSVAGLAEDAALDILDEVLEAQVLKPAGDAEQYSFSHALLRQTLYTEMNPSRQVRLHRRVAEVLEETYGDQALDRAAELAYQYYQSAALPGAEAGAPYAIAAADRADEASAYDETASLLRIALELMAEDDERRPDVLARLGLALAWSLDFEQADAVTGEAAETLARASGPGRAADYLSEVARTMSRCGHLRGAWSAARAGLDLVGDRRDEAWAWLMSFDLLRREAEDPAQPGIPLDVPERAEVARIAAALPAGQRPPIGSYYRSRDDVLRDGKDDATALTYLAGAFRESLAVLLDRAAERELHGQIAGAVYDWSLAARCHNALGDFADATSAYEKAVKLSARLPAPSPQLLQLASTRLELRFTTDFDASAQLEESRPLLEQPIVELSFAAAPIRAVAATGYAWLGQRDEALRWLQTLIPALERAPAWAPNFTLMANLAAYTLWLLDCTDHFDVVERAIREKVLAPDFRFPMQDGRVSMARLAALKRDDDEAHRWFDEARTVLSEQGARPLHAIVDLDEAEMLIRLQQSSSWSKRLVHVAREEFAELGMPGWQRRAERLMA